MNQYATERLIRKIPGFSSHLQPVNDIRLHYVMGGRGEPLVLLPGWPQTWWSFHRIMPALAEKYTVIVVDLRGMGDSDKPVDGYSKKNMARDIKELVAALGFDRIHMAGHDIGASVAYALAANYPENLNKLILLDTPPPDENMYRLPMLPVGAPVYPWWVAFNQVRDLPAQLLEGRFELLLDHLLDKLLVNKEAISDFDRSVYVQHYNSQESIKASNAWYQTFGQDISDQKNYATIENATLGIASSANVKILDNFLSYNMADYKMMEVSEVGHFLHEEEPEQIVKTILDFLN